MYMDISQFVSETIKQICIGIKEAKEACKEKNDPVAPVAIKGVRLDESVQMIFVLLLQKRKKAVAELVFKYQQ